MKNTNKQLTRIINGMQIHAADMNNTIIRFGDTVRIPEPTPNDLWQHEFVATVIDYSENGDITVEDQDGDCYQMVPHIVEIVENN